MVWQYTDVLSEPITTLLGGLLGLLCVYGLQSCIVRLVAKLG